MNYTGMGAGTAHHYQHVASQMHSYMNGHGSSHGGYSYGGGMHSIHGGMHNYMEQNVPAYASHAVSHGLNKMGMNPLIANVAGSLAANFAHNLFS